MKLIDLLSIIDENKKIEVYDLNGKVIAVYDGKNGIDEKYNDSEVAKVENIRFLNTIKIVINRIVITSRNFVDCGRN